uniref:Metallophos domain-containing protein n=1 Tax=Syphacia muris TaxID=451379 RepID=A0A0N5A819_9BILA
MHVPLRTFFLSLTFQNFYFHCYFIFLRNILKHAKWHKLFAVLFSCMIVASGLFVAMSTPSVVYVDVPLRNLSKSQENITIALLTDIHIGPSVGRSRIQKIVDIVDSLQPGIVAIAGDLADGFVQNLKGAAEPLKYLHSKYGSYFATGNHEYIHGGVDEWFSFLRESGITPLHNEHAIVSLNESSIFVGHKMDYKKALSGCSNSTNEVVILLTHQPNAARIILDDSSVNKHIHLILSGHTHSGQMYVFVPIVYALNAFVRGLYYDAVRDTFVYVSAGVNYFGPPVKMISTCEIILLKLVKQV